MTKRARRHAIDNPAVLGGRGVCPPVSLCIRLAARRARASRDRHRQELPPGRPWWQYPQCPNVVSEQTGKPSRAMIRDVRSQIDKKDSCHEKMHAASTFDGNGFRLSRGVTLTSSTPRPRNPPRRSHWGAGRYRCRRRRRKSRFSQMAPVVKGRAPRPDGSNPGHASRR